MLEIHPNFACKELILELKTSFVLFEDNANFPWIILCYKKNVKNMLSMSTKERLELMKEIEVCEKAINIVFSPFQTNIAIFGNKTPWLHVHVIARQENDINFPNTVFEIPSIEYDKKTKIYYIEKIKNAILSINNVL